MSKLAGLFSQKIHQQKTSEEVPAPAPTPEPPPIIQAAAPAPAETKPKAEPGKGNKPPSSKPKTTPKTQAANEQTGGAKSADPRYYKTTLYIERNVVFDFKDYCNRNGLELSSEVEGMIREYLQKKGKV